MQEERKRSNSVLSSGSIISTASSNSHKRGKGRNKEQVNSLQVAGTKLGSNRKAYGKYDKSPFINISGNGRPSNGSGGGDPVILSMAARKKEM
jgi:hypothetical protein